MRLRRDGRFKAAARPTVIANAGVCGGPGVYGVVWFDMVGVSGVWVAGDGVDVGRVRDSARRFGFDRFMHSSGGREGGEAVRRHVAMDGAGAMGGEGERSTRSRGE